MNMDFLKKLCMANGVSGHESAARDVIFEEIKGHVCECSVDVMGNLIARKAGSGKKMMLTAHMDQVGLMVTYICEKGFLYFGTIGGVSTRTCLAQRFAFQNGTVGVCASQRLDESETLSFDKMYLDIGAENRADAEKHVKIGDVCAFAQEPVISANVLITPALDNRIGCFIMVEALKNITKPAFDLYFVFTSQEEVGLRGAKTAAFAVEPDYGLAFDVTTSFDTPKARKMPCGMYGGAAIKLKDKSLICHPVIIDHLEKCAKRDNIKYQFEVLEAGGTDAGALHVSKGGVPSGVVSVATRYIHTANEMCALSDVRECINLAVSALENTIS